MADRTEEAAELSQGAVDVVARDSIAAEGGEGAIEQDSSKTADGIVDAPLSDAETAPAALQVVTDDTGATVVEVIWHCQSGALQAVL